MIQYPSDRHGLIRREVALGWGITDKQLTTDVRAGRLVRLLPGVVVLADDSGPRAAEQLYRLKSIAVATSPGRETSWPLSHASAAAVHQLPLLKPDTTRVHVTNGEHSGGTTSTHRHVHAAPLQDGDVRVVDGIAVTSLERTAVDVATAGDFAAAFTAIDQALRMGADRDVMHTMLTIRRRRGGQMAAQALARANGRSDSVGESWSLAQIIVAGLPVPRQQHRIRTASGSTYYTDFDWDWLLVGEFDGVAKYSRHRRPGESVADTVMLEKYREDEIRDTGPRVARWTWAMLEYGELIPMLRQRLESVGVPIGSRGRN